MSEKRRLETLLIHAGERLPRVGGAAVTPIFQSSVFEQPPWFYRALVLLNPRAGQHGVLGMAVVASEHGHAGQAFERAVVSFGIDGTHAIAVQNQLFAQESCDPGFPDLASPVTRTLRPRTASENSRPSSKYPSPVALLTPCGAVITRPRLKMSTSGSSRARMTSSRRGDSWASASTKHCPAVKEPRDGAIRP